MIVTDKMVIAAGQAIDAHPWAQGKPLVPSWVVRAALEAAAQAAPAQPQMQIDDPFTVAQRGFDTWKDKPHNAKWWRKIDGSPIPNDVVVCIAEAFLEAHRKFAAAQAAPAPIDQGPTGALAAAMWDADNTTRLSEQEPEENDRQIDRAERVIVWLRRFNYDITPAVLAKE